MCAASFQEIVSSPDNYTALVWPTDRQRSASYICHFLCKSPTKSVKVALVFGYSGPSAHCFMRDIGLGFGEGSAGIEGRSGSYLPLSSSDLVGVEHGLAVVAHGTGAALHVTHIRYGVLHTTA